jgi:hypothetical protein
MTNDRPSEYTSLADSRSIQGGPSRSDGWILEAAPPLTRGAALTAILLSSLGLWALTRLSVSSLGSG